MPESPQPPPGGPVLGQVRPPGRHLPRRPTIVIARPGDSPQASSSGGEPPAIARRAGYVAKAAAGADGARGGDQPALDRHRAPAVDQLLADGPRQRLERLRTPPGRSQGGGAGSAPAAGRARSAVEVTGRGRPRGRSASARCRAAAQSRRRPRREAGAAARGPGAHRHRLPSTCRKRIEPRRPPAHHAVAPAAGHAEVRRRAPRRLDAGVSASAGGRRRGTTAWPARPPRARCARGGLADGRAREPRPGGGAPEQHEGGHPEDEPACGGAPGRWRARNRPVGRRAGRRLRLWRAVLRRAPADADRPRQHLYLALRVGRKRTSAP